MRKVSRPSSSQSIASSSTRVREAQAQAPAVVQDSGRFTFPTGDTYEGSFEAKKKDHSVKMFGFGVYTSAHGDTYNGTWDNDTLATPEVATVTYPDGAKYVGAISDSKYCGDGVYLYPDGSTLSGCFEQNCPVGEITLVDPNGHRWLGSAERGFAWLQPVNHYYDMLESDRNEYKNQKNANISVPEPCSVPDV